MVGKYEHTILISTDTVGGVWSYTISLVEAMQQHPIKFIIAAIGPKPDERQRKHVQDLPNATLEIFEGKLEWMENPWEDLKTQREWFISLSATYQPDLVHLNHYSDATLEFNAPKLLVMHSCVRSWWRAVKNEPAPDYWSRYSRLVQNAINASDEVIAPSSSILKDYKKEYRGLDKARVIYNGIETNKYVSAPKEQFIFSMGRIWDEAKNIQLLLKAAPKIDFPIYIAGNGHIEDKNLPSNVKFLGWLSHFEIIDWISRASIYCLPAKYEPFGLSFLEAAASGCVIVGGKINTLSEVWSDTAFLCQTDNQNELATLVNIIMKDEILRRKMAERAQERASDFCLKTTAQQYYHLYKSMNSTLSNYEY